MQSKSLHILIITSWYKTHELPHNGSFVEEQARMLQRKGHKVTIIHCHLKGTFIESLGDGKTIHQHFNDKGIQTYRIGVSPVLPKLRRVSYKKLFKLVDELFVAYCQDHGTPDLLHSHSLFMGGVIGTWLSQKRNVPQYHTEHTSGLLFQPNQYTKGDIKQLKEVYKHCKSVFFVSQFAKSEMMKKYQLQGANYVVAHNVVDPSFFTSPNQITSDTFSYLVVGSIIARKGIKQVLDSFKKVLKVFPNSKLTVAGEGDLKEELIIYSKYLGIDACLQWLPRLERSEVKKQIDLHHVVISASSLETFGLTIAEATSSGKPVVSFDSGGVRDIINEVNGVVTEKNVASFSQGLISVQRNYRQYNDVEIQEDARRKFSEPVILDVLISHYNKR